MIDIKKERLNKYKFDKLFARITTKNEINNSNILTISAQYGLISQEKFFNKVVASKDLSGYYYLEDGDFAYNKSYSKGYPMGAIKRLKRYDSGVVSPLYICFKLKAKDVSSEYIEHYFESGIMNKEIYKIAQEGARNHGLLNISVTEFFKDINLYLPSFSVQKKIDNILSTWDLAIEKQDQLIENKKEFKKGLIQRLLTGKIRFEEFNDKWETVSLSKVFDRVTKKNETECTNVLTISAQNGLINQENYFNKSVSSKDLSRYYLLKKGDFAYNKSYSNGYPLGAIKRLNKYDEGVVSPLYICFRAKEKINTCFYEQYFESGFLNKEIFKIAQEGARNHGLLNVSVTEFFKDIKILKPSLSEQEKIAEVLVKSDKEIELLQKELQALKLQKKGLMQRLLTGEVRVNL